MDYCSSCRRHLNGALVCPGCGAYAPDIAPRAVDGHGGPALAEPDAAPAPAAYPGAAATGMSWHVRHEDDTPDTGAAAGESPHAAAGVEDAPPAPQGRAARRRQLERWKKNKRRAAVASAVALVGGGLTIASMDRNTPARAEAAVAPDERSMGVAQERTPDQDRPVSVPSAVQRTPRSTPAASQPRSSATSDALREQSLAAPPRTAAPRTAAPSAPPEAAVAAHTAAPSVPQPQRTPPSTASTTPSAPSGTTTEQPSAPASGEGTNPGATQENPPLLSTSPTEICLLGLCLS
ncbi:hypothetical protein AB0E77_16715 [Streptomyces sp. NPDC032940]|uniref:SCO2400 family protein n=1 Tax=Streptomyces sp. NPDC032940 TaxID=3155366 RepID=UPI0033C5FF90